MFYKENKLFADSEAKSMLKKAGFFWLHTQGPVKSINDHKIEAKRPAGAELVWGVCACVVCGVCVCGVCVCGVCVCGVCVCGVCVCGVLQEGYNLYKFGVTTVDGQ
jgi:hypothetical protein